MAISPSRTGFQGVYPILYAFFDDAGKNVKAVQALSDEYPDVTIRARKVNYAKDIDENVVDEN